MTNTSFKEISTEHPDIKMGGAWRPPDCQSSWRIAIILPIRHREENLRIFIQNIIPFLKRQKADFTLFAVEHVSEVDIFLNISFKYLKTNIFDLRVSLTKTKEIGQKYRDVAKYNDDDDVPYIHIDILYCLEL